MEKVYRSKSSSQTKELGETMAERILSGKKIRSAACVLALIGELGSGKTAFLKGFARGLGVEGKILSPTFVILKKFNIEKGRFKFFYHIDCYRLSKGKEILNLGFKDIIRDPENIVAIEWADKLRGLIPKNSTTIRFYFDNEKKRKIVVKWNRKKS